MMLLRLYCADLFDSGKSEFIIWMQPEHDLSRSAPANKVDASAINVMKPKPKKKEKPTENPKSVRRSESAN